MGICRKCGANLIEGKRFCNKCGASVLKEEKTEAQRKEKLIKEVNKKEKTVKPAHIEEKKHNNSYYKWVGIIGLIFFLIIIPTRTQEYQVEVPYEDIEYYTETEPYETQEAYEKQVPYEATETYTDTIPIEIQVPYEDTEYYTEYAVGCDYDPGCSCTGYDWWTGECDTCSCSRTVTKYKTEIKYEDVEKERAVTKYKTETAYRTITKYREVQKSRKVMRTKIETRLVECNWIFGFKVPWKLHLF